MSGPRLIIGIIVMGAIVPITLFFLLGLQTLPQFFTVAATTVIMWGLSDLLAGILERPRLKDRSPGAFREEWERQTKE